MNADQVRALYAVLWDEYIVENQHLLPDLINAAGVSDMFCQAGHACQATELWRIRATASSPPSAATASCVSTAGR